eukprot:4098384-Amphidinium_carterae.2
MTVADLGSAASCTACHSLLFIHMRATAGLYPSTSHVCEQLMQMQMCQHTTRCGWKQHNAPTYLN